MLAGVAAIALGLDTGILARVSTASTGGLEQSLVGRLTGNTPPSGGSDLLQGAAMMAAKNSTPNLPIEGQLPPLDGAVQWLNSAPLTAEQLKGKVVLIDFWTYSCINCLRTLPYVKAWADKYRDQGLVVIGVHAPEFAFERDVKNVTEAMTDLGIHYPVAIDNDYKIWRAFDNQYWPAHYFADAKGQIRYHHFGEGAYDESERVIQALLREAGNRQITNDLIDASGNGVQQAAEVGEVKSPETYLGFEFAGEDAVSIAPPQKDETVSASGSETAVLADGGFWGVQGVFQHMQGVKQVVSGYAGGKPDTALYERVSEGDTGHAKSIEITFDPSQVSYGTLLQIFFSVAHNPTELNRQGPDNGTQYRSAIFAESPEQQAVAQAYIAQLDAAKSFNAPIVTKVEQYNGFYPADSHHPPDLPVHRSQRPA